MIIEREIINEAENNYIKTYCPRQVNRLKIENVQSFIEILKW